MIVRSPFATAFALPPLCHGDRLSFDEFCRRWDATPKLKRAELINGRVYMNPPPVNWDHHGLPTARILGWLALYEIETVGLELATDASVYVSPENCVQPDGALRIQDGFGGASKKQTDYDGPRKLDSEICSVLGTELLEGRGWERRESITVQRSRRRLH